MDASLNSAESEPDSRPLPVILLGLGFTTSRLARRLLCGQGRVFGVARNISRYSDLESLGLKLQEYRPETAWYLPQGAVVVHTIPPLSGEEESNFHGFLSAIKPRRVIYISSTSVYGEQTSVNAQSSVAPSEFKGQRRVDEEAWLRAQGWSNLAVRPAAIYGPGRGIHTRIREGRPSRTSGSTMVSRIHVDDLAAVVEMSLCAGLEGAWPLADHKPCCTDEISRWCADLLKNVGTGQTDGSGPISGRQVYGREIADLLGVNLIYPDYQSGILACLAEESLGTKT